MPNTHSPGDLIDYQCLRCKGITSHIVFAVVDDQVAAVICNVCHNKRKYRPPKTAKVKDTTPKAKVKSATSGRSRPAKVSQQNSGSELERLIAGRDPNAAVPYSMQGFFKPEELISHKNFGLGLVTRSVGYNKIEVLFDSGRKILICGHITT